MAVQARFVQQAVLLVTHAQRNRSAGLGRCDHAIVTQAYLPDAVQPNPARIRELSVTWLSSRAPLYCGHTWTPAGMLAPLQGKRVALHHGLWRIHLAILHHWHEVRGAVWLIGTTGFGALQQF